MRPKLDGVSFKELGEEDNALLVPKLKEKEIKEAIWNSNGDKCPGSDGLNFNFINKHFWKILKGDFINLMNEFHTNGVLLRGGRASFITHMPKKDIPLGLGGLQPMSLIGCILKVISKVLSNRVRKVLPKVIDVRQCAFLSERYMFDGVLISNEVVEEARRCRKECAILKVGFKKAYVIVS